jgi:hypothetical protein
MSIRTALFSIAGIFGIQVLLLWLFGQPLVCECGYIKLWEGAVLGTGNSQHLTDWYTFSHIIHGFLFYALFALLFPRIPFWWRLVLAVGLEVTWEIIENTPWVIDAYRQQALAQGYVGDSIINSVSDVCAAIVGFFVAYKLPVVATIIIAIALELFVGYSIRDNLTLNIIGFIHQFDFITAWQMAQ